MADPVWLLDKISAWHDGAGEGLELHEYLGWTPEAYAGYVETGRLWFTGNTCAHCGGPQIGMASVDDEPLCHPDHGMDCYHLVTVYGHGMPCGCVGSEHPDNDICDRCQYRRLEHPTDIAAEPLRLDFIGNPVPCWDFLDAPPPEHAAPF